MAKSWRTVAADLALAGSAIGIAIVAAEALGPLIARRLASPPTVTFYEESWRTVHFDPVIGYRLSGAPSRFLRYCDGRLEFEGVLRGNNHGFPDRDDFELARADGSRTRVVVFGDSFSAGQYLAVSWPDRIEDLARESDRGLETLNLSVDGGGLANWWSILHRWALPGRLEADLAVFAVFPGDLDRHFSLSDHRDTDRHLFARVPSWDPGTYPQTPDDARDVLGPLAGFVVDRPTYEAALRGEISASVAALEEPPPRFGTFLLTRLRRLLRSSDTRASDPDRHCSRSEWEPAQLRLVEEIDRDLDALGLRRIVVFIGAREDVVREPACDPVKERDFAERIDAEFFDGREMFSNLDAASRSALFFPVDGHWNQRGSDTFARYLHARMDLLLPGAPVAAPPERATAPTANPR